MRWVQLCGSFLSFIMLILAWNVLLIAPVVLERSLVCLLLLFSCFFAYSFEKGFLPLLAILWNPAFSWVYLSLSPLPFPFLLSSAICKASSDNHFAFLHFFLFGITWSLPPIQCYEPPSVVLHTLCLPDPISWIYYSPPLYNHKGFDLGQAGLKKYRLHFIHQILTTSTLSWKDLKIYTLRKVEHSQEGNNTLIEESLVTWSFSI